MSACFGTFERVFPDRLLQKSQTTLQKEYVIKLTLAVLLLIMAEPQKSAILHSDQNKCHPLIRTTPWTSN